MRIEKILAVASLLLMVAAGCTKDSQSAAAPSNGTGTGGSLARFTIAANHLYLANYSTVEVFDLANPADPVRKNTVSVNFEVETIFPYGDKLFIGSRDGMFIYSITSPSNPVKLGSARHVRSCDPVVANDSVAYVTLRGGSPCGPAEDGLYIYDIKNITAPVQKSLLQLSNPYGLGLKDSVVFVCRGNEGLSVVNAKKANAPSVMYTLRDDSYIDVIPYNNQLICYVVRGIIIYDITNLNQIVKLGEVRY
jgi:hypothetical protein